MVGNRISQDMSISSRSLVLLILLTACSGLNAWGESTIPLQTPMAPPTWALLERALLAANVEASREFFLTQVLATFRPHG